MPSMPERRGWCGDCVHFRDDPAWLEGAFAGLAAMGSAYASVRGEDGICLRHDRYLGARCWCAEFAPRGVGAQRGRTQPRDGQ
jgi:hypothetical protein